jgi:ribosomal-protein-alanine N-acetyltransferase
VNAAARATVCWFSPTMSSAVRISFSSLAVTARALHPPCGTKVTVGTPSRRAPIPDPDPPLTDGEVLLRWLRDGDARAVAAASRDPDIPRWTFMEEGLTPAGAAAWIERSHRLRNSGALARFAIVDAAGGRFLGQVGVSVNRPRVSGETFYWVAAPARRRGVATAALRLVSRWALESLGLQRLELFTDPRNRASQGVAGRAGYVREGTLRSYQPFKGRRMDVVVFSLLPADLDGSPEPP